MRIVTVMALCGMACGGTPVRADPTASLARRLREQERSATRLVDENRSQKEEIERLEGLLALARAEARDLRDAMALVVRERGPSEDPDEPVQERATDSDDAPRPMLRLLGGGEPEVEESLPATRNLSVSPAAQAALFAGHGVRGVTAPLRDARAAAAGDAGPPVQSRYREALLRFRERNFDEARALLTEFIATAPEHAYADDALYWRAEAFYAEQQYPRALADFEAVVERFPRAERTADALVKIGHCYRRLGNGSQAHRYFERVRSEYPESNAAKSVAGGDPS